MSNQILLFFIILFSICKSKHINNINIIGNEHTKSHIIEREVQHIIPGVFDSTVATKDRDRIYNLGLFSTVEIYQLDSTYNIFVIETLNILPLPLVNYDEGKGFSYGGSIAFLNFRGLNEKLLLGGIYGKENVYFINFNNPWIFGNHGSLKTEVYQYNTESSIYNFQYQKKGVELGTGLYYDNKHRFNLKTGIEYFDMDTTENSPPNSNKFIAPNFSDSYKYCFLDFQYTYDTRNIYTDPTIGTRIIINLKTQLGINSIDNRLKTNISFKKYFQLKNIIFDPILSLKSQILLNFTPNLPLFQLEYLGGNGFVRGYSPVIQENPPEVQNKIEGSQIIYESLQIQHTLIKKRDYFRIEAGLDIVYFIDFGIATNKISSFQISNLIYGYGMGLRLFVSGPGVLSLDFGFNPYGKGFIHPKDGNY